MARAVRLAVEAGRLAYLAGRIEKKLYATASSPLSGIVRWPVPWPFEVRCVPARGRSQVAASCRAPTGSLAGHALGPVESWLVRRGGSATGEWGIARQIGAYYRVIMRTISLKLPDDLLLQLDAEAKARRITKSSLVRESLEKALRKQSPAEAVSCYDLARDLAGTVKGLPKDLAHSPKYMEGFAG
jgi:hypothetical protein